MNEKIRAITIDWERSLLIDSTIDDELVRGLTPQILTLRQKSDEPITIGIDSPGGSLASLDVLLALLTGPNQDGRRGKIITVATHRAFSAAANLLAFGTYAVALRHSQVLYHDVRLVMEEITPEKARIAAKSLQDMNDAFALRLAHRIIQRLIWIYIDLQPKLEQIRQAHDGQYKKYSSIVGDYIPDGDEYKSFDLASFATSLWALLSVQNDVVISKVMDQLQRWILFRKIIRDVPTYRVKGSRVAGLLDGSRRLFKLFNGRAEHFEASKDAMKLFYSLIITEIAKTETGRVNFPLVIERATREYSILDSMNDPSHISDATELMLDHPYIFFPGQKIENLDNMPKAERDAMHAKAAPHARLLWLFCVLLCRELFEGEHILGPQDAQLLGLVDEVAGGGPVQSRRDFRIAQAKKSEETNNANSGKGG